MDPVVDLAIRIGLAVLFGVAALHKLRGFRRFEATVADYRIVPAPLAPLAAIAVLGAEVGIAEMLVLPHLRSVGLAAAAAQLVVYAGALALNLARGRRHLDCGCVGVAGREEISWALAGRNLVLSAIALVATLTPIAGRPLVWIDALTIAGAVAAAAGAYVAIDQLVANGAGYRRLREVVREAV
jgi:Methylamine utilisation protein MauE